MLLWGEFNNNRCYRLSIILGFFRLLSAEIPSGMYESEEKYFCEISRMFEGILLKELLQN